MTTPDPTDPRTRHYGDFYGVGTGTAGGFDSADSDTADPDGDVAIVIGNCQAESVRIMLDGGGLRTVRLPAVHELVSADLPHLEGWLGRASILVSQPVRDDYHDLPIGTRQLTARMSPSARTVMFPVVRFAGLYPAHAIIRPPADASLVPPLVEYHDLRLLAEAAGNADAHRPLDATTIRAVADLSRSELRRREVEFDAIVASDLFDEPTFDLMRTLNHPGNPIWTTTAARIRERLGLPDHVVDPGRPLLDSIHAPREAAVVDAWGLDDDPTDDWRVDGATLPGSVVREAHLAWYAEHPEVVTAGLARHRETLSLLGLA